MGFFLNSRLLDNNLTGFGVFPQKRFMFQRHPIYLIAPSSLKVSLILGCTRTCTKHSQDRVEHNSTNWNPC
eukprot:6471564-Amphidinium_carterae.1